MPIADLTAELVERLKYFSTQLRRLFPNASTIRHRKQLSFSTSPELAKPAVEGIVRLVWLHELYVRDRLSDLVEEAPAVGLTRIHLVDRFAPVEFLEIVRRNAPTLVDLCISSMYRNIYKDVVLDSEGAVVVYPNLKRFEASVTVYFGPTELASQPSPEGVLFPVLQHLSVLGSYLFSNDLLFRGNNTTLEYLTLGIDTNILETIETHHLFKPNSYPQLHYLDFLSRNIEHSATEQDAQALLRTPFNLGPNLQVVKIGTSVYQLGPTILNCVQQSMLSSEIQHLDIGGILLSLNDAVSLVKVLPNLTMLGCGLHIEIEGQTKYLRAKDVKQLYTDYFPVRSRLWYLKAEGNTRRPLRVMGELACVFAILVPSIYRIGFQNYAGENRSYICKQAYKRPAFKRYADRFDALRFD
ncbi:hypothetical protein GQ54DRAFT_310995 [Martensiomyces pterosporus]|nr:hypothetical protein GQ54DRAFT_310995 [Martensiomyces pterosporus]